MAEISFRKCLIVVNYTVILNSLVFFQKFVYDKEKIVLIYISGLTMKNSMTFWAIKICKGNGILYMQTQTQIQTLVLIHIAWQIAWVRCKEGFIETEGWVKFFLIINCLAIYQNKCVVLYLIRMLYVFQKWRIVLV